MNRNNQNRRRPGQFSNGLKGIAAKGFLDRKVEEALAQGAIEFQLKPNGPISEDDVKAVAHKAGLACTWVDDGSQVFRLAKVKKQVKAKPDPQLTDKQRKKQAWQAKQKKRTAAKKTSLC